METEPMKIIENGLSEGAQSLTRDKQESPVPYPHVSPFQDPGYRFKRFFRRYLFTLFDLKTASPNLIMIILCAIGIYLIMEENMLPDVGGIEKGLSIFLGLAIIWQLIVASTKSITIPIVLLTFSVTTLKFVDGGGYIPISPEFAKYIFSIGIFGLAVSGFSKV